MSDIKNIVPEKDWRKVNIQDYPATPTPQNVPSEHFLNGMSGAIKVLESVSIYDEGQFTSGYYRRYENGFMEVWIKHDVSTSLTEQLQSIYRTPNIYINTPAALRETYSVVLTSGNAELYGIYGLANSVDGSGKVVGINMRGWAIYKKEIVPARIMGYISGRWK